MLTVSEKNQNLRRLQAQRNELNAKVRMLREELQLLQEQGKGDALYSIVRLSSSNASSLNILVEYFLLHYFKRPVNYLHG